LASAAFDLVFITARRFIQSAFIRSLMSFQAAVTLLSICMAFSCQ